MRDGPVADAGIAERDEAAAMVPLVGLTGGMGAGKSTALVVMCELGADVLSTDEVVHELYSCERVRAAIVERWGEEVVPAGVISRQAVAERVFDSDEERSWLERLLWPLVGERVAVWLALARAQEPAPRAAVVETPLLFESGMDKACDFTIALVADERLRGERAAMREHARAEDRVARQLSQQQKAELATFVVCNNGSVEELRRELSDVLGKLRG